jgi:hypothetical protein
MTYNECAFQCAQYDSGQEHNALRQFINPQQCCLVHAWSWRERKLEDDLRLYSWLSETHERERITDLGEVVYLKFARGGRFTVGHYDNMRVDWGGVFDEALGVK